MCGRYYVDDSMIGRIEKALSGIDNRLNGKTFSGDIYPTNTAPVISAASDHLQLEENRWGYPGMNKKGVIINEFPTSDNNLRKLYDSKKAQSVIDSL